MTEPGNIKGLNSIREVWPYGNEKKLAILTEQETDDAQNLLLVWVECDEENNYYVCFNNNSEAVVVKTSGLFAASKVYGPIILTKESISIDRKTYSFTEGVLVRDAFYQLLTPETVETIETKFWDSKKEIIDIAPKYRFSFRGGAVSCPELRLNEDILNCYFWANRDDNAMSYSPIIYHVYHDVDFSFTAQAVERALHDDSMTDEQVELVQKNLMALHNLLSEYKKSYKTEDDNDVFIGHDVDEDFITQVVITDFVMKILTRIATTHDAVQFYPVGYIKDAEKIIFGFSFFVEEYNLAMLHAEKEYEKAMAVINVKQGLERASDLLDFMVSLYADGRIEISFKTDKGSEFVPIVFTTYNQ